MAGDGAHRLGDAAAAFTSNARNPDLRKAQLSFLGAWTAEWAFTVALGIVAYRDGGAAAVGLVGLLRMLRPRSARRCCPRSPTAGGATHPGPRLDRAGRGHGRCRGGGRPGRRSGGDLRPRRAVDHRGHPVPPGTLRPASLALPHRPRARQRQRRTRPARLGRDPRRAAPGRGAPRGRRRRRGVRGGRPPPPSGPRACCCACRTTPRPARPRPDPTSVGRCSRDWRGRAQP